MGTSVERYRNDPDFREKVKEKSKRHRQAMLADKEKHEKEKERDRVRKRKLREIKREAINKYQRQYYRSVYAEIRKRQVVNYKDRQRTERIINRVLKHFDAGSIGAGQLGDSVNEAIELCIAEINKNKPTKD